ncbi:MAG: triose-phosphate isomerase [Saprospiraceae bacterium]|nr:triose-phosphate isomerase [Saprospiraceae bacterium]
MRQKIAAGNWKMNLTLDEGLQLARYISNELDIYSDTQVILAAPYVYLKSLSDLTFPIRNLHIAAQNCHAKESGAYTGEIAIPMLKSINIEYVVIGHSERRAYFNESNAILKEKVDALIEQDMNIIFCCGEPLEVRKAEGHFDYVTEQLEASLCHLSPKQFKQVIIAYEPIWAIGTGETASPDQAQEMHAHIRSLIGEKLGREVAESTSILYGGSVKPANAQELFSMNDVDGGLVGGASLSGSSFLSIINAFS